MTESERAAFLTDTIPAEEPILDFESSD